jgi:uncharacterized protein YfaP (DUF2135 family)
VIRSPLLLLGLVLAAISIRGEVTIDLENYRGPRNAIIVRVNGDQDCVQVSDVFPDSTIVVGANRSRTFSDSTMQGSTQTQALESAIILIYNTDSARICSQGRRAFLTSTIRNHQERTDSTTISTFQVYELCFGCHQVSNATSFFELDRRKTIQEDNIKLSSFSATRTFVNAREIDGLLVEAERRQGLDDFSIFTGVYEASGHFIHLEATSRRLILRIRIDGDRANIFHIDAESLIQKENNLLKEQRTERRLTNVFAIEVEDSETTIPPPADINTLPPHNYHNRGSLHTLFQDESEGETTYNIGVKEASPLSPNTQPEQLNAETLPGPERPLPLVSTNDSLPRPAECSVMYDECCVDRNCATSGDVCVARRCIQQGNPRFTLTWTGDDDLNLFVETPGGVMLSYETMSDPVSGGRVGEPTDQSGYGYHAESVHFPLQGAPPGMYNFYVRPLVTSSQADVWTLTVVDNGVEIQKRAGNGFSSTFSYERDTSANMTPVSSLTPTERPCVNSFDECCGDSDCLFQGEICVHRTCIDDGNPRISLKWIGDDDLDLFVETPGGAELSFKNFFDSVTGARFGEEVDQFGSGYHIENVYFPSTGGPAGLFKFFVRPLVIRGDARDEWTVSVVENGREVVSESGYGVSNVFTYVRTAAAPSPSVPMLPMRRPLEPTIPTATLVAIPTLSQRTGGKCSVFFDQCCETSDCRTVRELCEQRTCIQEGNPRISLIWIGDDDLDLYVVTPDGVEISADAVFDVISGGRFERDLDQSGSGDHVENIYFPILSTRAGTYVYGVRSRSTRGNSPDAWTVEVHESGELVDSKTGSGISPNFSYTRDSDSDGPNRPRPAPPRCSPLSDECCLDSDCNGESEICVQRTCIDEGNPRFTLQWIGDDDLDLYVRAPGGTVIFPEQRFDPNSGGRYGEDPEQSEFGFHAENIYFPAFGTPAGTYTYFVRSSATRGVGADIWTISVFEDGKEVEKQIGIGESREFQYEKYLQNTISPAPTPGRPAECSTDFDECCRDQQCPVSGEICIQRTCIASGTPRFTLTWIGDDDLDLFVETPDGTVVFYANPIDQVSGGQFGEDFTQPGFGFHVENTFFPPGRAPPGQYRYYIVPSTSRGGESDTWTLSVFEGDQRVANQSGSGESSIFTYNIAPPVPAVCNTLNHECCINSDCSANGVVCNNRNCVVDGNPRFTLTWTGDDNLDLYVEAPTGGILFSGNRQDSDSGGRFEEDALQSRFGYHTENAFFPATGSLFGTYRVNVRVGTQRGGSDEWTVRVFENGVVVSSRSGTGSLTSFSYARTNNPVTPMPTPPPNSLPSPTSAPIRFPTPPAPTNNPVTPMPTLPPNPLPLPTSAPLPFPLPPAIIPERPPPTPPPQDRSCPHECCSNSDCSLPEELCVQRTCIREGSPRFTLTWTGNDDLSLLVISPNGETISYLNPTDSNSGGVFGEDQTQNTFGFHVENIYFPFEGRLQGHYTYFVRRFNARGADDRWVLRVFVGGRQVAASTGTGDSRTFSYLFGGANQLPTPPPTPPPTRAPIIPPTAAPIATRPPGPTPSPTNPSTNTCTTTSDCLAGKEVCVQRTCIDEGNPRFTLTWSGNDDLDFFVLTPSGATVSATNPFDGTSGGVFGESGEQPQFGLHIENIFFPRAGGPPGTYSYYVRSPNPQGSDDSWTITVFVDGVEVVLESGNGNSSTFTYLFAGGNPTPAPSFTALPAECLSDSECITNELCVQQTCIDEGNPRVTLTWTGDDDLDLFVITPQGNTVSFGQLTDPASGGVFGEIGAQFEFGRHVENVFFPLSGGPPGIYTYFVRNFNLVGEEDDWAVSVVVDGREIQSQSGRGSSATFSFVIGGSVEPTPAPVLCNPANEECCADDDCSRFGNEICVQRTCIDDGTPRFTLTWIGNDDLDLTVRTPLGTILSFANKIDPQSGGIFGEPGDQFEFGRHVENVFFPVVGAPLGTYSYVVRTFLPERANDLWTVKVFVSGQEVQSTSGRGASSILTFEFGGTSPPIPTPPPTLGAPTAPTTLAPTAVPGDCNINREECCNDSQCIAGIEICIQRTCIDRGSPRFTLVWDGDDDLDIAVETPLGTTLSFIEPVDSASGGVYGEDGSQFEFGMHVENVYFPLEGTAPSGIYLYTVTSFNPVDSDDMWTVTVFVDDIEVAAQFGFGNSATFMYDFSNDDGVIVPTQSPISDCNPSEEECCSDTDCAFGAEICVQRTCIDRGNPRFTLTWTGDDDLDLALVTPLGTTVAVSNKIDPESQGVFGEAGDQLEFGRHVENIYFPISGGPSGTYTYFVSNFVPNGELDMWTVTVFVDDEEVASQTGTGSSELLVFEYIGGDNPSPTPIGCNIAVDECCNDSDCSDGNLCVQRTCIDDGNPRITLTWTGDDDLDLTVTPPLGDTISFINQFDEDSGGRFGEDGVQFFFGLQVENIFFPADGGPIGEYKYEVQSFNAVGGDDTWTVRVFVGGEEVSSQSGNGNSGELTYDFIMGSNLAV